MTLVDGPAPATTLDRALARLDWTLVGAKRRRPASGGGLERTDAPGLLFVAAGSAELWSGSARRALATGDLVFFPRRLDRAVLVTDDAETVDASFAPYSGRPAAIETLPDAVIVHRFGSREPAMAMLLAGMDAGQEPREGDAVICSRIATTIASVAIRSWFEQGCAPADWLRVDADPHITRVLEALHADLERAWTVEQLARIGMMSRSTFAVRFREAVGASPASYLAAARVDAAMILLRDGALTVADVAVRLGYGSEAGFARAFRRHTGTTPALWRIGPAADSYASEIPVPA